MPDGRVRFSQPALDQQVRAVIGDEVFTAFAKWVSHVFAHEPCIGMVMIAFAPQQAGDTRQQLIGDRRVFRPFAVPGQNIVKMSAAGVQQLLKRLLEHTHRAGLLQLHPQMAVDRVPGEQHSMLPA